LSGDLNESALFPDSGYTSGHPIQKLISTPTGLFYTDPVNSITHTDLTESIRGPLDTRFDYILPCGLLFSNIASSQVFRTDLLSPLPAGLNASDDSVASDHLPVLMTFNNPFAQPIRVTTFNYTSPGITLQWTSVAGWNYRVDISSNLTVWTPFATNLAAAGTNFTFTTNVTGSRNFFRVGQ
jgi:hypothetical protein